MLTVSFSFDTGASSWWRSYSPSLTSSLELGVALGTEFLGEAQSSTDFEQVFEYNAIRNLLIDRFWHPRRVSDEWEDSLTPSTPIEATHAGTQ